MCIMSRFTVSFNLKHLRDASVLPGGSADKESTCKVKPWVQSLGWDDPLEKVKATHSSILA